MACEVHNIICSYWYNCIINFLYANWSVRVRSALTMHVCAIDLPSGSEYMLFAIQIGTYLNDYARESGSGHGQSIFILKTLIIWQPSTCYSSSVTIHQITLWLDCEFWCPQSSPERLAVCPDERRNHYVNLRILLMRSKCELMDLLIHILLTQIPVIK